MDPSSSPESAREVTTIDPKLGLQNGAKMKQNGPQNRPQNGPDGASEAGSGRLRPFLLDPRTVFGAILVQPGAQERFRAPKRAELDQNAPQNDQNGDQERFGRRLCRRSAAGPQKVTAWNLFLEHFGGTWPILGAIWDPAGCQSGSQNRIFGAKFAQKSKK